MQLALFEAEEYQYIAGVDEAGRGPLCGAVYAAAVILDPSRPIAGLEDSKKLSESAREAIAEQIKERALSWSIASASVEEIEQLNILQATLLAMRRAVEGLSFPPDLIRVDGNQNPNLPIATELVIKGDALHREISAASILAKVARDASMYELDRHYPQYGFAKHKGYGTREHLLALERYGAIAAHRANFAPVRRLLEAKDKQQER